MEMIEVVIDDGRLYDKCVQGVAKQASAMAIVTKRCGTTGGRAVAVIRFRAEIDGRLVDVQATTTVRCLIAAGRALEDAHGMDGDR